MLSMQYVNIGTIYIQPLDARDIICQVGTPAEKISWSVEANRTYMYTISRGGQIVKGV